MLTKRKGINRLVLKTGMIFVSNYLMLIFLCAFQENKGKLIPKQLNEVIIVRGRVTDEAKNPIVDAKIVRLERASSTKTDEDGYFVIAIPFKETLEFSKSDFRSKRIKAVKEYLEVKLKKK